MIIKLYEENPNEKELKTIIECLKDGGVIVYPTDTVYGFGCDIFKHKAVERIAQIKGIKTDKANFSFICSDLSHISDFTTPINNSTFRLMKKALPGAFTFILNANNKVPKLFQSKKKTVGIRVPKNNITLEIVRMLGNPIMSTSVHDEDDIIEYTTNPELIHEKYNKLVDIVIDGGIGDNHVSTVINCTVDPFEIIRQGKGDIEQYL